MIRKNLNTKQKGTTKWFNNEKGYGFIEYEGEDVYVHYTSIVKDGFKSLIKGESVEFELVKTENGYAAKNVRLIPIEFK